MVHASLYGMMRHRPKEWGGALDHPSTFEGEGEGEWRRLSISA